MASARALFLGVLLLPVLAGSARMADDEADTSAGDPQPAVADSDSSHGSDPDSAAREAPNKRSLPPSLSYRLSWPDAAAGSEVIKSHRATDDDSSSSSDGTGISKRSLASIRGHWGAFRRYARPEEENGLDKRHLGSLARVTGLRHYYGPKGNPVPWNQLQAWDADSMTDKRGLSSMARQGYWDDGDEKRSLSSLARQGDIYDYYRRGEKRGLSSLVRQGNFFGYGGGEKRGLSSLARQGVILGDDNGEKRGLSSLVRQGGFLKYNDGEKRGLSSLVRTGGYGNSRYGWKRGLSSLVRQGAFGDDMAEKRSLGSLARQGFRSTPVGIKKSLASLAQQGYFKRGLSSLARQGALETDDDEGQSQPEVGAEKRGLSSIVRQSSVGAEDKRGWGMLGAALGRMRSRNRYDDDDDRYRRDIPSLPRAKPQTQDQPKAAEREQEEEEAETGTQQHARGKRSLPDLDWSYDAQGDEEAPTYLIGVTPPVKRHLGSLVHAYMMPTGYRSGWMSRYGRNGPPRPHPSTELWAFRG